jgi:uncharacterized protein HemX
MTKEMDKIEERFDSLEKATTEIKTSIRWARLVFILLVPFIITGIGTVVMMYSGQNQFQRTIDKHFTNHEKTYEPMIQTNRENILVMKSEKANTDKEIEDLEKRVDGNNRAINEVGRLRLKSEQKTGRRYR